MKSLILSLVIGALIVWGSTAYTGGLERISNRLANDAAEVRRLINEENFDEALHQIDDMRLFLEQKRTMMEATGKHDEIDEIEISLEELRAYTESGSQSDASARCAAVEFLFRHLPKNFKLRIENIL